ncbi:MAG: 3-isopropylmalate dehydratase small subunit [Pseudomonadota bacterium]
MKAFNGNILFLDRSDINTDEIIPAKYLTELTREALKPYLLEDLVLDGFIPGRDLEGKAAIVSRTNFGCGSSREHAPWALEMNGINLVIASGFARIFRQNMFNCGMLAVDLAEAVIDGLFKRFNGRSTWVETDLDTMTFTFSSGDDVQSVPFLISDFGLALVRAGGWVDYADQHY